MNKQLSSSAIVCRALGLMPNGVPMKEEGVCCMCGTGLHPGDLFTQTSLGDGFTDGPDMALPGGKCTCGDCTTMMRMKPLMDSGYGVFTEKKHIPFRKWDDITNALLNPPEEPFVACYATSKSQHMAWRSPVNYSREAFRVRVGSRSLLIRRQRLIDAPVICARVANAAFESVSENKAKKKATTGKGKTLPNPFITLSPDLKEINHGVLHPLVGKALKAQVYPEITTDVQWLNTLTAGELWALRFILTPGAGKQSTTTQD